MSHIARNIIIIDRTTENDPKITEQADADSSDDDIKFACASRGFHHYCNIRHPKDNQYLAGP